MPLIKNVSPVGDLDLPLVNRQGDNCIKAGEEFDVTDEQAALLLDQPDNFQLVEKTKKTPASTDKNEV